MPIYVLGARNRRVQIPNQALTVSISGSACDAALVVRGGADQPVMRPAAQLAVLPRVTGPVSVGVVPADRGAAFDAGTVVNLAIGHDTADDLDPVQVVFDPVDVGGDAAVELATLTPLGAGVEVAAAAVADHPLSPLASAARTSARKVVGRGARAGRGAVLLALDASVSMRPLFADGSAAAAADVVVGVADAVGVTDVSAVLVGEDRTPVPAARAGLAGALAAARPRWCAGARWSRLTDTGARTIVCSDFPTAAVRQRFPVIAVSPDRRLDNHCVRIPPPRPGAQAAAELAAHPAVLDAITAALVRVLL